MLTRASKRLPLRASVPATRPRIHPHRALSTATTSTSPEPRPVNHAHGTSSTVNAAEIAHFSRLSSLWWDEQGEFGLLHKMNPVRVDFIRDKLLETARDERGEGAAEQMERSGQVLEGMDVLDVGCGGGLLAESLARLGGRTLGVDASPSNIAIASTHASADPRLARGALEYRHTAAETLVQEGRRFDVVCALEVLEHVDNPRQFLSACADLVKPGGHLFLSTIARTPLSYLLTIFAAENVLRLVEPGTHTHAKYVNPDELLRFFQSSPTSHSASSSSDSTEGPGWISRLYSGRPAHTEAEVRGIVYVPWLGRWELVSRGASGWATEQCNYVFWVRKPHEARP